MLYYRIVAEPVQYTKRHVQNTFPRLGFLNLHYRDMKCSIAAKGE